MVKTKGWGLTKGSGSRYANSLGEMNSYVQMVFEDRGLGTLELHRTRMTQCLISQQTLQEPVVACRLGNLYNKEAVIGALLNKTMPGSVSHVRALKDVKQCIISWAEAENEDGLRRMVCPVTREDLDNGSARAVVIWPSGAVISAKAVKEMKMKECPVTSKPFDPTKDVIPLAPQGEELQKLQERLPAKKRKASAAAAAPATSSQAEEAEEVPGDEPDKGEPDAKAAKKDPTKESDVYKRLFTKDREGLTGTRDAFGTPIYNRGSRVC
eukprot:TRINITY_DN75895_c0_g1_i1.p1 TRINITY_DN75895_c0_g1~~TRINITY_DN75895_c0_g1_i1.p1  ORF type:complete len:309 (+),score=70.39 TRINITY_DN75895_c0_g1_i1:124-927(+)